MDLYERIMELGSMGYHCSQIIMIMTLETIGEENPQLVKAMGGLGGGIGYCGDTCGCLTDWGVIMEKCPGLIADTYTKVMEILTEREVLEL